MCIEIPPSSLYMSEVISEVNLPSNFVRPHNLAIASSSAEKSLQFNVCLSKIAQAEGKFSLSNTQGHLCSIFCGKVNTSFSFE